MNIRLGRMPWAIGGLFFVVILAARTPPIAAESPSPDDITRLVNQLGAENFDAREAAAAQLTSLGEPAIRPLVDSICSSGPETAWRSTAVLQQIALADHSYAKVLSVLREENKRSGDKFSSLIRDLSARSAAQRRHLAQEKIRALGGRFGGDQAHALDFASTPIDVPQPEPPPDLPPAGIDHVATAEQTPTLIADAYVSPLVPKGVVSVPRDDSLTIDENWRGGDEGLASLCDLPRLCTLTLSRAPLTDAALDMIAQMPAIQSLEIEDMRFSPAAIAKFRTRQPQARIVARGSNFLEVKVER
jgi:hypothetical protein